MLQLSFIFKARDFVDYLKVKTASIFVEVGLNNQQKFSLIFRILSKHVGIFPIYFSLGKCLKITQSRQGKIRFELSEYPDNCSLVVEIFS